MKTQWFSQINVEVPHELTGKKSRAKLADRLNCTYTLTVLAQWPALNSVVRSSNGMLKERIPSRQISSVTLRRHPLQYPTLHTGKTSPDNGQKLQLDKSQLCKMILSDSVSFCKVQRLRAGLSPGNSTGSSAGDSRKALSGTITARRSTPASISLLVRNPSVRIRPMRHSVSSGSQYPAMP